MGKEMLAMSRDRGHVLVVDDEVSALKAMKSLLESEGFSVTTAENGQKALDKLAVAPPDILVTDLKMPDVDGLELLQRAKMTYDDLPVIVVTAFGAVDTAIEAMRRGAVDYLQKPIQIE